MLLFLLLLVLLNVVRDRFHWEKISPNQTCESKQIKKKNLCLGERRGNWQNITYESFSEEK